MTMGLLIVIVTIEVLRSALSAFSIPGPDDIPLEKEIATRLVMEFDEFGKITELNDCRRAFKSINGFRIRMHKEKPDFEDGRYYKDVLSELDIHESDFERFRAKLEKTKLRSYFRTEKYSVFIVDGFLDDIWGYLYAHSEDEIPNDYIQVGSSRIKVIEDLGDNWYLF